MSNVIRLPLVGPDDVDQGPITYVSEHRRSIARTADRELRRRIAVARRAAVEDARAMEKWRAVGYQGHQVGG